MDKYIKEIKVFTFPELNGEAKEKAKEWYLNDETLSWELTDSYESDLSCIFPNSDLKVQWSLSYCQGDGVNIYGSVNMEDIFSLPQNTSFLMRSLRDTKICFWHIKKPRMWNH